MRNLTFADSTFSEVWREAVEITKIMKRNVNTLPNYADVLVNKEGPSIIYGSHNYLIDMANSLGTSHAGWGMVFLAYLLFKWCLGQCELW